MHDELRQGRVERVVLERQVLGRRTFHDHPGKPRAGRHHERVRRIDSGDAIRANPGDELRGQCSGTAPHVDDRPTGDDTRKVCETWCERDRVTSHEPVIGIGGDVEAHRRTLRSVVERSRGRTMPIG